MPFQKSTVFEYFRFVTNRMGTIVAFSGVSFLVVVLYILIVPTTYRARAVVTPVGGGAAFSSQAASLIGQLTGGTVSSAMSRLELLAGSTRLLESLTKRLNLVLFYYPDADKAHATAIEDVVKRLREDVFILQDMRLGALHVIVRSTKPQMAADIANGLLDEIQKFVNEHAMTDASRSRIYLGEQLMLNYREVLESGKELARYYREKKISPTASTIDVSLRLQPRWDETPLNQPADLDSRLESHIDNLMREKEAANRKLEEAVIKGVPQHVYLEYLTQKRSVLGSLNMLLSQAYELAKMQEVKEDLSFQIIDAARAPRSPDWPNMPLLLVVGVFAGLFLGVLYALFTGYLLRVRQGL